MKKQLTAVCIYCGSSAGARPEYSEAARLIGREIADRGLTLVYGGGDVGLMGIAADAALEAGGRVLGIIPHALVQKEVAHHGVSELIVVADMHERKHRMSSRADVFIALPGGLGTLEELFEMLTWSQLGIHNKPVGLLNVAGFYDQLLAFVDHSVSEGFVREGHRRLLTVETSASRLIDQLAELLP